MTSPPFELSPAKHASVRQNRRTLWPSQPNSAILARLQRDRHPVARGFRPREPRFSRLAVVMATLPPYDRDSTPLVRSGGRTSGVPMWRNLILAVSLFACLMPASTFAQEYRKTVTFEVYWPEGARLFIEGE